MATAVAAIGLLAYGLPKLSDAMTKGNESDGVQPAEDKTISAWFHEQQLPYSGIIGGQFTRLVSNFEFPAYKPPPNVMAVGHPRDKILNLDYNPMEGVWQEHIKLKDHAVDRLAQKLWQQRPLVITTRRRGIANPLTRELINPKTGASTGTIDFAYMPADPGQVQQQMATEFATRFGEAVERRRQGNERYFTAPGQSFIFK